jgi:hypothetical protein
MEVEDEKGRRLTGNEAAALARGRIADARSGMVCACVERSLGRGVMDVIPVGKSFFSLFCPQAHMQSQRQNSNFLGGERGVSGLSTPGT